MLTSKIHILLAVAAVAVMASSCATLGTDYITAEQEYNNFWVGRTHADIVKTYGAPDRIESDGNTGQILVYESLSTTYDTDVDPGFGMFGPEYSTRVSESKKYTHFFMNSSGVCYLVRTNRSMPGGRVESNNLKWIGIGTGAFLLSGIVTMIIFEASAARHMAAFPTLF